jgi:hypothetical protein
VVDRAHIPFLPDITLRLSNLKINGDVRRFVITRMGSTGSTWLAKLLDSHPDVHCSHEGFLAQVYPANQSDGGDVLRFIEYFAWDAKHEAYQVVGDIGSVWPCHLAGLPSFTTAILLRHPARILNTRLTVYPTDQSFSEIPAQSRTGIRELWGIDLYDYEPIDQIFLHDTFTFASQVWALDKADLAIRIEDMRGVENCQRILKSLTGLDYSPMLVEQATRRRANRRTHETRSISEIVAGFTARQRDWYNIMLSDIVPYFGYRLLEEFEDGIVPMVGEKVSTEMNASPIRRVAGQFEEVQSNAVR